MPVKHKDVVQLMAERHELNYLEAAIYEGLKRHTPLMNALDYEQLIVTAKNLAQYVQEHVHVDAEKLL